MSKTSPDLRTTLHQELEQLAGFEAQGSPVISLYLNLTPDQHGRDNYEAFCRKSFADRLKAFKEHSPERASFKRDIERINAYLANELNRPANALALFACAGAGEFFEAVQLDVPIEEHWLFIGAVPHIYPLARLIDQYPRYASVVLDTNRAHIIVFSLGAVEKQEHVTGARTRRSSTGGWSQARYQRRAENLHLHHMKEVVDTLDRIVRVDNIQHIIVSGDEVAVPLLKEALPAHIAEKILDVIKLDRHVVEDQIAAATLDVLRDKDAEADAASVAGVLDAWRAGGLSVVGPEATMKALQTGQVEELLITASPQKLKPIQNLPENAVRPLIAAETSAPRGIDENRLQMSDEFVALANKTGARVRFIESPELLREHGGVAAMLRFRL